jgi:predicted cobalt transporter CbtA
MPILTSALANLLIILLIGVVAGLFFNRYSRSWLARIGGSSRSDLTSALVGIAGAFIGFHLSVIVGLLPSPLMHYLVAVAVAAIVLWLWRGR